MKFYIGNHTQFQTLLHQKGFEGECAYDKDTNEMFCFTNGRWIKIFDAHDFSTYVSTKPTAMMCKNCGAPLNLETLKCEYCGTEYLMMR